MQSLCYLLLALIGTLAIIRLIEAQDQQGFISLDCGLPDDEPSPYFEPQTKLQFTSDAGFIQTGITGRVDNGVAQQLLKPYTTLRYFPNGVRNCYDLNVTKNTNYLIRAMFEYGNYNGLNNDPNFDLYLGPNTWATIDFSFSDLETREIMYIPTSNTLQVCLVKTGNSTPFISSLELRPFRNDIYITQYGSLSLYRRKFLSNPTDYIRHPLDVHDRIWLSNMAPEWTAINTTLKVNASNEFDPPKEALMTDAISKNATAPFTIDFPFLGQRDQVYVFLHFAEIQTSNGTREFSIVWNGNSSGNTWSPRWLQIDTVHTTGPLNCNYSGTCNLQLVRTPRSTLPPLLNAYEVFTVIQFPWSQTDQNDVSAIKDIKTAYRLNRINWQGDPCVPRHLLWDGLNCSYGTMSTPSRIISLNFSSSGLTGTITSSIQYLSQFQVLDLSNNSLVGEVPEFLANMTSLRVINLSRNNLRGTVPQALYDKEQKGLELHLDGNPNLCNSTTSCNRNNRRKFIVPIVATVASVAAVSAVLILFLVFHRKKASTAKGSDNPSELQNLRKKRRFTYSEVMVMTNNFQKALGKGGFGDVYHGYLHDIGQVAVKTLSESSTQGHKQFKTEVELLLRVHHTNLVSLVGYCDEGDHLALIYEYMPNGDLKKLLSGRRGGGFTLSWERRVKIAMDAAIGLEYLHTGCRPPMVHRDVKSTNILLDEQLQAKLADFGLSRSFPFGNESHVSTVVAGTPGYLDPEYYHTNWLTEKSDVYSFGIVILEIITNRPVIDQTREKAHIADWVALMLTRGDIKTIVDPKLRGDHDIGSVWKAVELAMSCVNPSSKERPNMSWIVHELKECLKSEDSRTGDTKDKESISSDFELNTDFDTEILPRPR